MATNRRNVRTSGKIGGGRVRITLAAVFAATLPWPHPLMAQDAPPASNPDPAAAATPSPEPLAAQPAPQSEARFLISEFRVEGNTVFSPIEIELTLLPFLGENKAVADIESARVALETRYRDQGFGSVLVDIPEQDILEGVVTLRVIEGRVESLTVSGSRYFSLLDIRRQMQSLRTGSVPNMTEVSAQVSHLNRRTPNRSVTPLLRPGRTPGTIGVELRVKDEFPAHARIEVNDRYGANTSKTRLNLEAGYDNLWQRLHSASLQYQTSPEEPDEVQVWSGTYVARARESDRVTVIYLVRSDSNTASIGDLNVLGKGRILGLREIIPFAGNSTASHSASLGVDYKDFDETLELQGADAQKTPLRYLNWSGGYTVTARADQGVHRYNLGVNFGLRDVVNDPKQFDVKRDGARANYTVLRLGAEYTHWFESGMDLFFKLDGQLSDSPLVSNEQFAAGGAETVRGYLESQELGDYGAIGTIEWRSPSAAQYVAQSLRELRALVFVSGAVLNIREPLPRQSEDAEIYSTGIGVRIATRKRMNAALDWAVPLKASRDIEDGEDRLHASLELVF